MKKRISNILVLIFIIILSTSVFAQSSYTVKWGDTMWKIASRHQVGLSN